MGVSLATQALQAIKINPSANQQVRSSFNIIITYLPNPTCNSDAR